MKILSSLLITPLYKKFPFLSIGKGIIF